MRAMLQDVRVLELGTFITAPFAAMLLAELGADVVKVERPDGGDPFRTFSTGVYSSLFQAHNRHKRSVTLDYTKPEGLAILHTLAASADVFVINTRAGVAEKLGIGHEVMRAANPRLIYCSITGFGKDGPYVNRPAFDNVGQALSGWSSRQRRDDDPRVTGPAIADPVTSYYAALGIMGALHERQRTGTGSLVEVNMLEATIGFTIEPLTAFFVGKAPIPVYQRGAMSQAYNLTCADGKRIGLHTSSVEKFWQALCRVVDRAEWIEKYPTRMERVNHYEDLARQLKDIFQTHDRDYWMAKLSEAQVPFAPENEIQDVENDPQVRHLKVFHEMEHPKYGKVKMPHRPIRVDGDRDIEARPPPDLGEHTDEVLRAAGISEARLAKLRESGLI